VTDCFQDGRRRHIWNSSECYKMGNYHLISLKIGTQTKKHTLKLEITKAEMQAKFQDGRRRHSGQSSAWYKLGNYHRILMKIDTQTKKTGWNQKSQKRKCRPISNMTAAVASLEIQVHAIKWAIITRFWWKLVHRLRNTWWVQKSQKRKLTAKNQQKLNVKNDIVLKGQRCMNAKL
jgi:hypothetical protein